jgi:hypothetical protein
MEQRTPNGEPIRGKIIAKDQCLKYAWSIMRHMKTKQVIFLVILISGAMA